MDASADCGLTCGGSAIAYPVGQAPYTYLWQPGGQTTPQITNLCPGSYTVTVTDSLGCIITDSLTINGSPILNVWISNVTNPSCVGCNDGSLTGSVNGGTPGYYPYWSPPIGFGLYTVSGIGAGPYQFCVVDTFGCVSCVDTALQDPLGLSHVMVPITNSYIELFDLSGRLIWQGQFVDWQTFNMNGTLSGCYIIVESLETGEKRVRKVVIPGN